MSENPISVMAAFYADETRAGDVLTQLKQMDKDGTIDILDAAVMFKAGWEAICDHIEFVEATESQRTERALARSWNAEELSSREAAQTPLEVKRGKAALFVDNSGTPEQTFHQVKEIWQQLAS